MRAQARPARHARRGGRRRRRRRGRCRRARLAGAGSRRDARRHARLDRPGAARARSTSSPAWPWTTAGPRQRAGHARSSTATSRPASTSCRADACRRSRAAAQRVRSRAAADGGPLLVLVHGTFVDTASTFDKLWDDAPAACGRGCSRTTASGSTARPPDAGRKPDRQRADAGEGAAEGRALHLLTHSRGGLVAEVLARACAGKLTDEDLALFADVAERRRATTPSTAPT